MNHDEIGCEPAEDLDQRLTDPDRDDLRAFQAGGTAPGGDRAYLAALWQRHAQASWRLAQWICGDRAEDALQDAALQLVQGAARWRDQGPGSARAWLLTIVANAARIERRRERRRWWPLAWAEQMPHPKYPNLEGGDRSEHLRQALAGLSARQRQPVELRYLAGLDFPAVAAALGVSERTARSRVTRSLNRLRRRLGVATPGGSAEMVVWLSSPIAAPMPASISVLVAQQPAVLGLAAARMLSTASWVALSLLALVLAAWGTWLVPPAMRWVHAAAPVLASVKPQRPALGPGLAAEAAGEIRVMPTSSRAEEVCIRLMQAGGPPVQGMRLFGFAIVPSVLRGRMVSAHELITAVAASEGLHITWYRQGTAALLARAAPASAIALAEADLAAADPALRRQGAWLAGSLQDPQLIPALVRAGRDGDRALRIQVLRSVRQLGWPAVLVCDPSAMDLLRDDLDDRTANVRWTAAWALRYAPMDPPTDILTAMLGNDDPTVRCFAFAAVEELPWQRRQPYLDAGREDSDPLVRQAAAVADCFDRAEDTSGLRIISQMMDSPNRSLRMAAVDAARDIDIATGFPLLCHALANGDAQTRSRALRCMCDMHQPHPSLSVKQVRPLFEAARRDSDAAVRQAATFALGALAPPVPDGWDILAAHLDDPDVAIRRGACAALGNRGGVQALALLAHALEDRDPNVRIGAVDALGEIDGIGSLDLLKRALTDPAASVRHRACLAAGTRDLPQAVSLLGAALTQRDPEVRSAAIFSLGYAQPSLAWPLLRQAYAVGDERQRSAVLRSAGKQGGPDAILMIQGAIRDQDITVRDSAAEALGEIAGDQAIQLLEISLSDPSERVRESAISALDHIGGVGAEALLGQVLTGELSGLVPDMTGATVSEMIGGHQAHDALAHMQLETDSETLRGLAAQALGEGGSSDALILLTRGLDRQDPVIRRSCIHGLACLFATAVPPSPQGRPTDPSWQARNLLLHRLATDPDRQTVKDILDQLSKPDLAKDPQVAHGIEQARRQLAIATISVAGSSAPAAPQQHIQSGF